MADKLRIDTVSAYMSVDAEGNEGVCAWYNPGTRSWMPLIAADHERMESMRPIARDIARASGQRVVLVRFETRTDLEEILP